MNKFTTILLLRQVLGQTLTVPLTSRNSSQMLGADIDVFVDNVLNEAYLGTFTLGTPIQQFNAQFQYDSTFKGVAVTSSTCTTCTFPLYDPSLSSTFSGNDTNLVTVNIQGAILTGYYARDSISLGQITNPDPTLIDDFEFFIITDASNMTAISGVIGFGTLASSTTMDSYVDKLVTNGKISFRIASWLLSKDAINVEGGKPSSVTFGGSFTPGYINPTYKYESSSTQQWELPIKNILLGGKTIKNKAMKGAIFDTTETSILLSDSEWSQFTNAVTSTFTDLVCSNTLCYTDNEDFTCSSFSSYWPTLGIQIDKQVYNIPPLGYCIFTNRTLNPFGPQFVLAVGKAPSFNYVLGTVFMNNFYTEMNFDDQTITLAKSLYASSDVAITKGKLVLDYYGYMWAALAALVLIILGCVICRYFCKRADKDENIRGSSIYYDMDDKEKKMLQAKYGTRVSDVSPRGSLYNTIEEDPDEERPTTNPKGRNRSDSEQDSEEEESSEEEKVETKKKDTKKKGKEETDQSKKYKQLEDKMVKNLHEDSTLPSTGDVSHNKIKKQRSEETINSSATKKTKKQDSVHSQDYTPNKKDSRGKLSKQSSEQSPYWKENRSNDSPYGHNYPGEMSAVKNEGKLGSKLKHTPDQYDSVKPRSKDKSKYKTPDDNRDKKKTKSGSKQLSDSIEEASNLHYATPDTKLKMKAEPKKPPVKITIEKPITKPKKEHRPDEKRTFVRQSINNDEQEVDSVYDSLSDE